MLAPCYCIVELLSIRKARHDIIQDVNNNLNVKDAILEPIVTIYQNRHPLVDKVMWLKAFFDLNPGKESIYFSIFLKFLLELSAIGRPQASTNSLHILHGDARKYTLLWSIRPSRPAWANQDA